MSSSEEEGNSLSSRSSLFFSSSQMFSSLHGLLSPFSRVWHAPLFEILCLFAFHVLVLLANQFNPPQAHSLHIFLSHSTGRVGQHSTGEAKHAPTQQRSFLLPHSARAALVLLLEFFSSEFFFAPAKMGMQDRELTLELT
jgi:hypothetical protein